MKRISDRQKRKNMTIAKIKRDLIEETGNVCRICGNYGNETAHLLPKGGQYCQYYTEPRNLVILCHSCHVLYDNDILFRREQESLKSQILEFAFQHEVNNYFDL
jgi:hypothetical protein